MNPLKANAVRQRDSVVRHNISMKLYRALTGHPVF
jgi:hypothetical protein